MRAQNVKSVQVIVYQYSNNHHKVCSENVETDQKDPKIYQDLEIARF